MATTESNRISVNIVLEDGTDTKGNLKTTSIPLGTLDKDNFNADKALAIVSLLEPCLCKTLYNVEKVEVSTLSMA